MPTLTFKTNINCQNCIRSVTPHLNANFSIDDWQVDTDHPDKTLTLTGEITPEAVISLLSDAGFEAEQCL
ncbi:MAG: heavy-metal-associated domain-containing protein [Bernardetiaceae bacterium]